ncbi:MAG: restriction endonuclease subunit S [Zoogloeaceae bacterium]|nr:restriction endonuclease subunit S [Zoogloeaceae bacterium]
MSHYKPYPTYKDSEVEWIGKVPEHWDVMRLRHVAAFKNSNVDKKAYDGQEAVSLCNYTDVYYNEFITPNLPFMQATASPAEIEQFTLKKGDVIITKDSEDPSDIGIPSLVKEEVPGVVCGYHLTMIRVADFDTARLLHRILQSHPTQAHFFVEAPGITRYGLSQDAIGDLRFCLPPANERAAITDHLDRETAYIDALIAKKTKFIELLTKKRQALITHAVTKGLNPKAKMKQSGVEWIGEVPEHWNIVQSRRLFSERKERARDGDVQLTASQKYGVIPQSEFMEREGRRVMLVSKGHDILKHIEPEDFLISMRSFEGGLEECKSSGCVSSAYVPLAPIKWVWNPFFRYLFKSTGYIQALQSTSDLVRDGQALRFENFSEVPLLHVDIDEQRQIAEFLDRQLGRIDGLITKTQLSIDLLKKRRSALITAAVTGQIDLRESA